MSVLVMAFNKLMVSSTDNGALGNAEYPFTAISPRSTLGQSDSTQKGLIYWSNTTFWHLIWLQTNDLRKTELFEIELFDHLTVCKQMTV